MSTLGISLGATPAAAWFENKAGDKPEISKEKLTDRYYSCTDAESIRSAVESLTDLLPEEVKISLSRVVIAVPDKLAATSDFSETVKGYVEAVSGLPCLNKAYITIEPEASCACAEYYRIRKTGKKNGADLSEHVVSVSIETSSIHACLCRVRDDGEADVKEHIISTTCSFDYLSDDKYKGLIYKFPNDFASLEGDIEFCRSTDNEKSLSDDSGNSVTYEALAGSFEKISDMVNETVKAIFDYIDRRNTQSADKIDVAAAIIHGSLAGIKNVTRNFSEHFCDKYNIHAPEEGAAAIAAGLVRKPKVCGHTLRLKLAQGGDFTLIDKDDLQVPEPFKKEERIVKDVFAVPGDTFTVSVDGEEREVVLSEDKFKGGYFIADISASVNGEEISIYIKRSNRSSEEPVKITI